jgi:hypothetical protein
MRSRLLPALIVLAGLALLILWAGRRSPRSAPAAGERADLESATNAALEPAREAQRDAIGQHEAPPQEEPADVAPAPVAAAQPIEGVLRVTDEEDRDHDDLDGSFLLTADDEREGRTIAVHAGRFATELRVEVPYRVERIVAGERAAVPLDYELPRRGAEGEWEVVARWVRPTVLVITAADTGLELGGIDLLEGSSDGGCQPSALDDAHWLARDATSPIRLTDPSAEEVVAGTRTLHARAPAYAWGCVVVPEALGGEFRLALVPAGALEIHVSGQDESVAKARLRLRPVGHETDDPSHDEELGERTTFVLESLEEGRWIVTLELGHRWRWPRTVAREEVEVRRGGRASVELLVRPVEEPELVPLAGRVRASRAWSFRELSVTAELLDEPPRGSATNFRSVTLGEPRNRDEEPAVWEWSMPGVQAGRWSVSLPRLGLGLAVDVPAQGRTDVEIAVPDPVEVAVELRERGSERPVPDARLGWMPPRSWCDVGGMLFDSEARSPGSVSFRAPAGPVELWCFAERHRFVRETIEARAPRTEHVLRLDPACGFVLRLRHGTTLLSWPFSFGYEIEAGQVDGAGRAKLGDQDANEIEARFVATAPGRYRLELPRIPGYTPIPPQEILVPPEGFVRLDVELRAP